MGRDLKIISTLLVSALVLTSSVSSKPTNHSPLLTSSKDHKEISTSKNSPNPPSKKQRDRNRSQKHILILDLLRSGKDREAIDQWERLQKNDPHELGLSDERFAWYLAKAFMHRGSPDKGIQLYRRFYYRLDTMTEAERAAVGEEIIFGGIGVRPDEVNVAIGHGQCPLCHSFVQGLDRPTAPSLHGIIKRSRDLIASPAYQNRPTNTEQPEAFPGSGRATTTMEYLAESNICPSCFIALGKWFSLYQGKVIFPDGSGASPEPRIHKPPISLTMDEMIAIDTWLFLQEGQKPPPLDVMRAAYYKFVRRSDVPTNGYIGINLAALYDAQGDLKTTRDLLKMVKSDNPPLKPAEFTPVNLRQKVWLDLFSSLDQWPDNPDMFVHLKHDPELVQRYPDILKVPKQPLLADPKIPSSTGVTTLAVAYQQLVAAGEYPRWSPDGTKLLFTRCGKEGCSIWEAHPALEAPYKTRILIANGAYGDWSPDGKNIVYVKDQQEIWLYKINSYQPRLLTPLPPHAEPTPLWSANGQEIFVLEEGAEANTCSKATYNLESQTWKREPTDGAGERQYRQGFSGAHQHFLESDHSGPCQAFSVIPTMGSESVVDFLSTTRTSKAFSIQDSGDIQILPPAGLIWAIDQDGTFATLLVRFGRNPVFSPDKSRLVYEHVIKYKWRERPVLTRRIHIARLHKISTRVKQFSVKAGLADGIAPGDFLLVYSQSAQDSRAIGTVRVSEAKEHRARVQIAVDTHHPWLSPYGLYHPPILPGDTVKIPRSSSHAVLLVPSTKR